MMKKINDAKFLELYYQGKVDREIGEILGVNNSSVWYHRTRLGLIANGGQGRTLTSSIDCISAYKRSVNHSKILNRKLIITLSKSRLKNIIEELVTDKLISDEILKRIGDADYNRRFKKDEQS